MQPRLLREPVRLAGLPLLRLQSDERLVRLARQGHPPAFTAIVDRYRPALLRYCTRLVGEQRAEDAVQQAFVNAHRALTEREDEVDLRPWLYRIAHNASLNTLRGDTDGWSLDDPSAAAAAEFVTGASGPSDDVEATVVRREHLRATLDTISGLPAAQRDALLLRELEGRSHVEIAGTLGVTAGAARQHVMRARAAVRAAVTAVTPYPLAAKLATSMTLNPTGERLTQAAAGAGIGAGVAKVSAGVLATGAIVGGAVGGFTSTAPVDRDRGRAVSEVATAGRTHATRIVAVAPAAAVPIQATSNSGNHSRTAAPLAVTQAGPATGNRRSASAGPNKAPTGRDDPSSGTDASEQASGDKRPSSDGARPAAPPPPVAAGGHDDEVDAQPDDGAGSPGSGSSLAPPVTASNPATVHGDEDDLARVTEQSGGDAPDSSDDRPRLDSSGPD
ncbi:MAG: polymerase, sigma-24 subunit, subfamily [Solirubrobacterales bacterium]|nr:polymerase, sigma-24 subunit, subfamily [Solirubrobacterales bacterium]